MSQLPETLSKTASPAQAAPSGSKRGLLRALARPSLGEVDVELRPWASPTGCLLLITEQADRD